ncbi:hypothetical protein [Streptomyces mirabilis]
MAGVILAGSPLAGVAGYGPATHVTGAVAHTNAAKAAVDQANRFLYTMARP